MYEINLQHNFRVCECFVWYVNVIIFAKEGISKIVYKFRFHPDYGVGYFVYIRECVKQIWKITNRFE